MPDFWMLLGLRLIGLMQLTDLRSRIENLAKEKWNGREVDVI